MVMQTFRLVPTNGGGFHFGREGRELEASSESLPSDSLFAALIAAYVDIYGDPAPFLAPWLQRQPPFRISSVLPYAGDVPLLPMPRLRVKFTAGGELGLRKQLKRLRYVSPRILAQLLAGEPMDNQWGPNGPAVGLQDGVVWLHPDDRPALPPPWNSWSPEWLAEAHVWRQTVVPRVTVDRLTNSSTIYQAGRTVFAGGCGLWFLAEVSDWGDWLAVLVEELGQRGLGGERSAGYGGFYVDTANPLPVPNLPPAADAPRVMTLARYHPSHDELAAGVLGPGAAYELVRVGGWLSTPTGPAQRRRQVRMIEAGSVLKNRGVLGQLVDVCPTYDQPGAPPHPIYRSGFALTVGVSDEPTA